MNTDYLILKLSDKIPDYSEFSQSIHSYHVLSMLKSPLEPVITEEQCYLKFYQSLDDLLLMELFNLLTVVKEYTYESLVSAIERDRLLSTVSEKVKDAIAVYFSQVFLDAPHLLDVGFSVKCFISHPRSSGLREELEEMTCCNREPVIVNKNDDSQLSSKELNSICEVVCLNCMESAGNVKYCFGSREAMFLNEFNIYFDNDLNLLKILAKNMKLLYRKIIVKITEMHINSIRDVSLAVKLVLINDKHNVNRDIMYSYLVKAMWNYREPCSSSYECIEHCAYDAVASLRFL